MAQFQVEHHPGADGTPRDLGSRADITRWLAIYNVAPEVDDPAELVMYGPGIQIEFPDGDPVTQFLLTEVDTDISHRVLVRIARDFDWVLTDINTGTKRHMYRPPFDEDEQ
jgi:hypothetical protein